MTLHATLLSIIGEPMIARKKAKNYMHKPLVEVFDKSISGFSPLLQLFIGKHLFSTWPRKLLSILD